MVETGSPGTGYQWHDTWDGPVDGPYSPLGTPGFPAVWMVGSLMKPGLAHRAFDISEDLLFNYLVVHR